MLQKAFLSSVLRHMNEDVDMDDVYLAMISELECG